MPTKEQGAQPPTTPLSPSTPCPSPRRHFLTSPLFRCPGEAQKIDRLLNCFSRCVCVYVSECLCVCVGVYVCVRVCVCKCVRACVLCMVVGGGCHVSRPPSTYARASQVSYQVISQISSQTSSNVSSQVNSQPAPFDLPPRPPPTCTAVVDPQSLASKLRG